jgi:hypothetical protein
MIYLATYWRFASGWRVSPETISPIQVFQWGRLLPLTALIEELGYRKLFAPILAPNIGSMKVLEHAANV